ncbi:helix-turn-helix domain-containing protein [Anaerococcus tetradius]|uniref:DNA-binding helix-turn-helix protein n=1 Tax=Anaerococcus tetradius TaxID=33036 RepID=A0A133KEV1_9FIRM|nr:helix-turn-helix transcriptional regulator [Anaerococcus tetradius]KWZ77964.1 DNA-binding helix-turn-helix protein [Anaerococcus tetradius]
MIRTIGDNIAFFRRKKGITQKELAQKVGLSVSFISHLENDISNPSNESLSKISNILGVSNDDLLNNGKNCSKNEESELLLLLIDLTRNLKIQWEKLKVSDEMYSGYFYRSIIQGSTYDLKFDEKIYNQDTYYENIDLRIASENNTSWILSDGPAGNYNYLKELLESIFELERDKSPLFDRISELEKLKNDTSKD